MDSLKRRRIYRKPPLIEAVLEFRFLKGETPWDSVVFGRFYDRAGSFARTEDVGQLEISLEPSLVPFALKAQTELKRFYDETDARVATVGADVFGFSVQPPRLAGLHTWEALRDEALRLLSLYQELANPGPILRIGLRYVNAIAISPAEFRLGNYVSADAAVIPPALLTEANPFKFRIERILTAVPAFQHKEIIHLAAGPSDSPLGGQVVLDTDEVFVAMEGVAFEDVQDICDELHGAIHDVFETVVRREVLEGFMPEPVSQES